MMCVFRSTSILLTFCNRRSPQPIPKAVGPINQYVNLRVSIKRYWRYNGMMFSTGSSLIL